MIVNSLNANYQSLNQSGFHKEVIEKSTNSGNEDNLKKIGITTAGVASCLLPLFVIRKYQGKKINFDVFKSKEATLKDKAKEVFHAFDVDYNAKEMIIMGMSTLLGGLGAGLLLDKENSKEKKNSAMKKTINLVGSTILIASLVALTKKLKLKGPLAMIGTIIAGVAISMILAKEVTNKFVDKQNKESLEKTKKVKLDIMDYLIHLDDIVGVLLLCKVPFANKLQLDKFLTGIYTVNGIEAGLEDKNG